MDRPFCYFSYMQYIAYRLEKQLLFQFLSVSLSLCSSLIRFDPNFNKS